MARGSSSPERIWAAGGELAREVGGASELEGCGGVGLGAGTGAVSRAPDWGRVCAPVLGRGEGGGEDGEHEDVRRGIKKTVPLTSGPTCHMG